MPRWRGRGAGPLRCAPANIGAFGMDFEGSELQFGALELHAGTPAFAPGSAMISC